MLTWFIRTKKMARPRRRSTPSSLDLEAMFYFAVIWWLDAVTCRVCHGRDAGLGSGPVVLERPRDVEAGGIDASELFADGESRLVAGVYPGGGGEGNCHARGGHRERQCGGYRGGGSQGGVDRARGRGDF